MRIAICDDEAVEIQYLTTLVEAWARQEHRDLQLCAYKSAEAFLFDYQEEQTADILLLDIQMEGIDGVTLAKQLRNRDRQIQIIFITGFADFMAQGYEVEALHYLMKPVDEQKLFDVLNRAVAKLDRPVQAVIVETERGKIRIPIHEILYAEAFAHTSYIRTENDSYEAKLSIGDLEAQLDAGFFRCHRSYLVGLRHVSRIGKTDLTLDNGHIVPIARRSYKELNLAFIAQYRGVE